MNLKNKEEIIQKLEILNELLNCSDSSWFEPNDELEILSNYVTIQLTNLTHNDPIKFITILLRVLKRYIKIGIVVLKEE